MIRCDSNTEENGQNKTNKNVMAKAVEVHNRLKLRILRLKGEGLLKVKKVGSEKEQTDGEKVESSLGKSAGRG